MELTRRQILKTLAALPIAVGAVVGLKMAAQEPAWNREPGGLTWMANGHVWTNVGKYRQPGWSTIPKDWYVAEDVSE